MKSFKKIEPLSNFQIIEKCKQLKIKNFKGVFMRDELKSSTDNECTVINIDHSSNEGTHWTCLFIENNVAYYFDSFGLEPPLEIKEYCRGTTRYYNSFRVQNVNEVICGHYCIYVLYGLSREDGSSLRHKFEDIQDELFKH